LDEQDQRAREESADPKGDRKPRRAIRSVLPAEAEPIPNRLAHGVAAVVVDGRFSAEAEIPGAASTSEWT
jgi:hypothetical protein